MSCERATNVQAYADGELDAIAAAEIERHLEICAECSALNADIKAIRAAIKEHAPYYRAGDSLRKAVSSALDGESGIRPSVPRARSFWTGAASGAIATALAASLALFFYLPSTQDEIANDVVAAHLRSLMGDHLIDIASSNRHVVKPWFAGRADISPPATDYAQEGFALAGGRIDYVHGERAAAIVYRHGSHVVNVFAMKDDNALRTGWRVVNGYRLLSWRSGNLFFCEVSDMAPGEMQALSQLIQKNMNG